MHDDSAMASDRRGRRDLGLETQVKAEHAEYRCRAAATAGCDRGVDDSPPPLRHTMNSDRAVVTVCSDAGRNLLLDSWFATAENPSPVGWILVGAR
ncbi:hypothetical protein FJT64_015987 [Amphibalanus amphitrite]|uniref:Uncharacterized protein n=1 Tax=Amphibalanus amphitrite TaxID=1232801 RepID=A0A6A4XB15_AMPAM|nr:hypothetical protein FJT64_015987 [Amphibalanus amphitrite]